MPGPGASPPAAGSQVRATRLAIGVWLPTASNRAAGTPAPLGAALGWAERELQQGPSCPRDPGDDVSWVGLLFVAGARQNSQDQSGSAGSTGCLPALPGRFCISRHSQPHAHRSPGHRPGSREAELLHTWVLGSASFLGCWTPRGTVLSAG